MTLKFCDDEFWDLNLTWYTNTPDFSLCFQDTVLTFLPSTIFCCFGLFELGLFKQQLHHLSLPWTYLNGSKLGINFLTLFLCVSLSGIYIDAAVSSENVPISTLMSSCARSVLFIIITFMLLKHKKCGVVASTLLSVLWIILSLCSIVQQRSLILKYFDSSTDKKTPVSTAIFIMHMVYYSLIYIQLLLSIFADRREFNHLENGGPFEDATFISFITFSWFNKTIYKSTKKLLSVDDMIPLSKQIKATYLFEKLSKNWNILEQSDNKQPSLGWTLLKSFWPWLIVGVILDIILTFFQLLPPIIMVQIIDFASNEQYAWRGTLFCVTMFAASFTRQLISNNCTFYLFCLGAQVKSVLSAALFRKNLWISSFARKTYTSGKLLNLASVDVERIAEFSIDSSIIITAPLKVISVIFIMWHYLGPTCLTAVGVLTLLIPLSFYVSRLNEKYTDKQMEEKDTRLKYMNEILSGIKLLKFYAWELPFSKKVSETRKKEMKLVRLSQLCFVITRILFACAPFLMTITTFSTFLLINSKNVLTPARIFVTLSLLEQLKLALFEIPDAVSQLIQTLSSLDRLRSFFLSDQLDTGTVGTATKENELLTMENATLSWSMETESTLKNINLSVPTGKLVAVTGPVGSGKSSLLSAILGEMNKITGTIDSKGSIAYVPQQAWIQNQTVKENILFIKPMKDDTYNKVLDSCCLRQDLDILPGGDETEIGEKGINLSGGQKQRVSLARAVYQNKDLYLLDDPLSAVDVHVRKSLFEDVIGKSGLLRKKTRILVTHDISVLPNVDFIVTMSDGKIVQTGTYSELMKTEGAFRAFFNEHTNPKVEDTGKQYERTLSRVTSVDSTVSRKSFERSLSREKCVRSLFDKQEMAKLIEEEKMEIGEVKREIYFNYIKHFGLLFFISWVLGFAGFVSFEAAGNTWLSKWNPNQFGNGTQNITSTTERLSVYGAFVCGQVISYTIGIATLVYGSTKASELYHKEMLECVLKCPMSFFDTTPLGRVMNRFSADIDIMDTQIVFILAGWLDCLFYIISGFVIIGMNTPIFLAAVLPLGIIYYLLQRLHLNASRQIKRLESTTRSPVYSYFLESIQGVSSIKAYQVQKEFIERFDNILDKHITCYFSTISCNRWLQFSLDFLGSWILLASTILAVENRYYLGPSIVGLVITYALNMEGGSSWLVRMNTELENRTVSVERVDEYTHLKSEAAWRNPENDPSDSWPSKGEIVFDSYSTKYRKDLDLALKEINFSVSSNEKVGIVGRTGAGKSSITLALFRIIEPVEGTIFIDDIDATKIGLHALRSNLSIIPQDPVLFTGTIRFNLDPNNCHEDEEIWKSLDSSYLKDFVSNLSEGLEYEVEEGGVNLSAGQRQLLCLSRALLKKTKILVLDEATAAVDMDTDQQIQTTIRTTLTDHIVITIAHRLNTVIDYDKVIVMDSGKVVESGKPEDLLRNKESIFFKMAEEAGLT